MKRIVLAALTLAFIQVVCDAETPSAPTEGASNANMKIRDYLLDTSLAWC